MRQKNFVLPVQCKRCNALFDLWYDLSQEVHKKEVELSMEIQQSLCWRCRREVVQIAREQSVKEAEVGLTFDYD